MTCEIFSVSIVTGLKAIACRSLSVQ